MNIITGYTGEPHITSAQDRDGNQGSYGVGSYILNVGDKLEASIVSANEIRIADGVLSHQGCLGNIDRGSYESLAISNGEQGLKRSDLIVCRYEKDAETNVESLSLVVIEGAAGTSPVDPTYNTGNIQEGDSPVDFPLYRVNINGVNVSSVTQIAEYARTQKELEADINTLNEKLVLKSYTVTPEANAYVSPFTYHSEFTIPVPDQGIGSPIAWSMSGGGSTDPVIVKRSSTYGFRVYATKSDNVNINVLFMRL